MKKDEENTAKLLLRRKIREDRNEPALQSTDIIVELENILSV